MVVTVQAGVMAQLTVPMAEAVRVAMVVVEVSQVVAEVMGMMEAGAKVVVEVQGR
jgi:hypothetical protein